MQAEIGAKVAQIQKTMEEEVAEIKRIENGKILTNLEAVEVDLCWIGQSTAR